MSFLSSPTASVWPGIVAAPASVSCWSGKMIVMSKAVGCPLSQLGRKMSAGQLRNPGIRDGTSFWGAKAADCAAENSASRRESC